MCANALPLRIPSITSTSCFSLSAPGLSLLLITYSSATSMTPALSVWMPSPDSGTSTSTVVSAVRATSSSVCPTPTVSSRMRSNPKASSRSVTSSVVVARPPRAPRVAIDRMNTFGSRLAASIRIRSPSSAPPVNGLVGSPAATQPGVHVGQDTLEPIALILDQADGAGQRCRLSPLEPLEDRLQSHPLAMPQALNTSGYPTRGRYRRFVY